MFSYMVNGLEYVELEKGHFESVLVQDGREVAYTWGEVVRIGEGFLRNYDAEAVKGFAVTYGLPVVDDNGEAVAL